MSVFKVAQVNDMVRQMRSRGQFAARGLSYDPQASGLAAADIQTAIDLLAAGGGGGGGGSGTVTSVSINAPHSIANPTTTPAITIDLSGYVPITRTVNGQPLSANVTVTTITGNAGTATALQTARAINGVNFDGTAAITVTAAAGTLTGATLNATVTASSLTSVGTLANLTVTNPITGSVTGSSGSTTGNAATATALQTARAINGVNFDGTGAITVTAAAGTLTGATLAAGVTASSLTSFGASIALGTPASGTLTNCTFPTLNQNTTGSAAKWTTARNLAGNSVDGSANVAFANKFIVQGTADAGLSAAQFLGALATGIVKNTTTTGVLSIAVAGDFPTLNQSTTGSAATLTTPRAINGVNFDGSAAITVTAAAGTLTGATLNATVTASSLASVGTLTGGATGAGFTVALGTSTISGILGSVNGGTGNGFTKFSGPTTTEKTFTLPNASDTLAALGQANTWTGVQQFGTIGGAVGKLVLAGSTSGSTILNASAVAGTTTVTVPGTTGTLVVGPASSTNTAIAVWNGTTGQLLRDSQCYLDASGNLGISESSPSTYGRFVCNGAAANEASALGAADSSVFLIRNSQSSALNQKSSIVLAPNADAKTVVASYYAAFNGAGDTAAGLIFGTQFNAAGGAVERLRIDHNGNILNTSTGGLGYGAGSGGTITQGAGSGKATAVTLNKGTGEITLNNAALAAATIVSFTLTNSVIAATDTLVLNHVTTGTRGAYGLNAQCAAGSAVIYVRNNSAGSLSEAIVVRFTLIKGATT